KLDDAALSGALAHDRRVIPIGRTGNSTVYELPLAMGASYEAKSSNALLFSQLHSGTVALVPDTLPLQLAPSAVTADPRLDWVSGRFGWRYRAWLPDSIYPFAWTVAKRPISFGIPAQATCVVAAAAGEARLIAGGYIQRVAGSWRNYALPSNAE